MHQRVDGAVAPSGELHGLPVAHDVQRQQLAVGAIGGGYQVMAAVLVLPAILRQVFILEELPDGGGGDFLAAGIGDGLHHG